MIDWQLKLRDNPTISIFAVLDKVQKDTVVEVKRIGNRILVSKLILEIHTY